MKQIGTLLGRPVVEDDSVAPATIVFAPLRRTEDPIDYERAGRIASLIHLYYTDFDNATGGNLHIVLDDDNIEDGYIESCLPDLERENDHLGIAIAKMLIEVSVEERARAIEAAREMR